MEGEPVPLGTRPSRRRTDKRLLGLHRNITRYLDEGKPLKPSSRERLARVLSQVNEELRARNVSYPGELARAEILVLRLKAQSYRPPVRAGNSPSLTETKATRSWPTLALRGSQV